MNPPPTHPNDPSSNPEWRRMIRSRYDKEILLRMENGTLLCGQARDMNEKGFFLFIDAALLAHSLVGQKGSFLEDLHGEQVTIPCQIVRVTDSGVGVQFVLEP